MIQPQPERISLADFLAWEQSQEHKHELLDGEILAFSGGSFDHNDISLNVCRLLDDRVIPPCKAHNSDTIIETRASKAESGLRADASVSCSSEDAGKAKYMRHARIVVEVRSPSNVGEKWENKLFEYRDTRSIEQIVIIESDAFCAIVRARRGVAVAPGANARRRWSARVPRRRRDDAKRNLPADVAR